MRSRDQVDQEATEPKRPRSSRSSSKNPEEVRVANSPSRVMHSSDSASEPTDREQQSQVGDSPDRAAQEDARVTDSPARVTHSSDRTSGARVTISPTRVTHSSDRASEPTDISQVAMSWTTEQAAWLIYMVDLDEDRCYTGIEAMFIAAAAVTTEQCAEGSAVASESRDGVQVQVVLGHHQSCGDKTSDFHRPRLPNNNQSHYLPTMLRNRLGYESGTQSVVLPHLPTRHLGCLLRWSLVSSSASASVSNAITRLQQE